jgi:hypothetical protein
MADAAEIKPKPSRWRRRLVIGLLSLIVLFAVILIWFFIKREFAKQYLKIRMAEEQAWWRAGHPAVDDSENRRLAYLQIDRLLVSGSVSKYEMQLPGYFEFGMSWPPDDAILRRIINGRKCLTDALVQSYRLPSFGLAPDFAEVSSNPMPLNVNFLHDSYLATLAVKQVWIYLREGKYADANLLLSSLVRKSVDHTHGGIMDTTVGLNGIDMAMAPLFEGINRPGWTAKDLRALADSLEMELDRAPPFSDMCRKERLWILLFLTAVQEDKFQKKDDWIQPGWGESMYILGVRRYDKAIEKTLHALEMPRKQGQDALHKIISDFNDKNFLSRQNPSNFLMLNLSVDFAAFRDMHDRSFAYIRVAIASLRMQAAHMETGGYPASMEALSKIDGRTVLMDPFDEAPLKIKLDPNGSCRVYSIGANMTDDGGNNPQIAKYAGVSPTIVDPALLDDKNVRKGIPAPKTGPPGPPGDDYYFHLVPLPAKQ